MFFVSQQVCFKQQDVLFFSNVKCFLIYFYLRKIIYFNHNLHFCISPFLLFRWDSFVEGTKKLLRQKRIVKIMTKVGTGSKKISELHMPSLSPDTHLLADWLCSCIFHMWKKKIFSRFSGGSWMLFIPLSS